MVLEAATTCNLCRSDEATFVSHADRYGHTIRAAMCDWCGLVRLFDRLTPEAYAEFYRSGEYRRLVSAYHGREINAQTIQVEQASYAQQLGDLLAGQVQGGRTLLDIGGSTGVVANAIAQRFGMSATLIDPAARETAVAKQFGIETVTASAESWETDRRFDLVLLCQTIDHLLDPLAVLRKIRRLLTSSGVAFVDILDLEAEVKAKGISGTVKIDHPFYFTRRTALAMFRRAQLKLDSSYAWNNHIGFVLRTTDERAMGTDEVRAALGNLLAMDMQHQ